MGFEFDEDDLIVFELDAIDGVADESESFGLKGVVFHEGGELFGEHAVFSGEGLFAAGEFFYALTEALYSKAV